MSRSAIALQIFLNVEVASRTASDYPSISVLVNRSLDDTSIISLQELQAIMTSFPLLSLNEPLLYQFVAAAMTVGVACLHFLICIRFVHV